MKLFTTKNKIIILLLTTVGTISCSKDNNIDKQEEEYYYYNQNDEVTITENTIDENIDIDGKTTGSCSSKDKGKPGRHSSFRGALNKMILYRTTGGSDNSKEWENVQYTCSKNYFAMYGNKKYMILQSDGKENDRIELKLDEDKNIRLGKWSQMKLKVKMYHAPKDSGNKKKGFTFAQVHNRGDDVKRPFVRLEWSASEGKIKAIVSHNRKKGESDYTHYIMSYSQGENLEVTLQTNKNKKIWIKIKNVNQKKTWSKTITPKSDWKKDDVCNDFYYSTGPYQQLDSHSDKNPVILYEYLKLSGI